MTATASAGEPTQEPTGRRWRSGRILPPPPNRYQFTTLRIGGL